MRVSARSVNHFFEFSCVSICGCSIYFKGPATITVLRALRISLELCSAKERAHRHDQDSDMISFSTCKFFRNSMCQFFTAKDLISQLDVSFRQVSFNRSRP